jgi:hypothetical protein
MSRFIRVKTGDYDLGNGPIREHRFIDLDSIIEVQEDASDASRCYVTLAGCDWSRNVYMPAEAIIAIIEHKEGKSQP